MDIGDLVFLGVLLASGIGSVIGAAKKKNKAGALTPKAKPMAAKPAASPPDTGLPPKAQPRPAAAATAPPRPMTRPRPKAPPARAVPVAASTASPARPLKRNRWREYVIMKEVLGPPKSMQ